MSLDVDHPRTSEGLLHGTFARSSAGFLTGLRSSSRITTRKSSVLFSSAKWGERSDQTARSASGKGNPPDQVETR